MSDPFCCCSHLCCRTRHGPEGRHEFQLLKSRVRTYLTKLQSRCSCLFQDAFQLPPVIHQHTRSVAVRIFHRQGAFKTLIGFSKLIAPQPIQSQHCCQRLYTRCLSHVAIRQVFRPKRKVLPRCAGRISAFAAGIFLMSLTQSTMFKDMYGGRRQVRTSIRKSVKLRTKHCCMCFTPECRLT